MLGRVVVGMSGRSGFFRRRIAFERTGLRRRRFVYAQLGGARRRRVYVLPRIGRTWWAFAESWEYLATRSIFPRIHEKGFFVFFGRIQKRTHAQSRRIVQPRNKVCSFQGVRAVFGCGLYRKRVTTATREKKTDFPSYLKRRTKTRTRRIFSTR